MIQYAFIIVPVYTVENMALQLWTQDQQQTTHSNPHSRNVRHKPLLPQKYGTLGFHKEVHQRN